ncbi:MAG: YHS domain-containing protein [Candidatus Omnitrophota bacterium]|nr:YHS domain-containing protein [Candidatus Omnitrophota bacterium]
MDKKLVVLLLAAVSLFAVSKVSYAMMCGAHDGDAAKSCPGQAQAASQAQSVNAGNKTCPVTGEKIDEATKATYEYNGKAYNLCCAACIKPFKKDPEKYIAKMEQAAGSEHSMQEGHQRGH